jgi:hypothetical protein
MTRIPILAALAALTFGCTGQNRAQDMGERAQSLVHVSLAFSRDASQAQSPRFEASGHFVRVRANAERAGAVLGLPNDEGIPLDSCRVVDGAGEIDRALAEVAPDVVELLDAGRLAVRGPVDGALLSPRHYPELTPYVSGVVYGADEAPALALEPGAVYEVVGEGGEGAGPFAASVQAPRSFPSIEAAPLKRGGDLDLRWSEAGEVSEPLVITVAWSGRAGAREVRCRVRDDGSFRISREFLQIPEASAELTATRSRRSSLTAPGVGRGELVIGLRDVVGLPVGEP